MNDLNYITALQDGIFALGRKVERLETDNDRLREALQALYDVQNGCPLPKYQAEYDVAIVKARAALQDAALTELTERAQKDGFYT